MYGITDLVVRAADRKRNAFEVFMIYTNGKETEMGNNTDLYELTGRTNALRGIVRLRKQAKDAYNRNVLVSEIEAIMGWDEECCQKCGHPAQEDEE